MHCEHIATMRFLTEHWAVRTAVTYCEYWGTRDACYNTRQHKKTYEALRILYMMVSLCCCVPCLVQVLICNLGQLLPAPLLKLLPDTVDTPGEDEDESETDKSAEYDPEQGGRVSPVLPSKAIIDVDAEMVGAGPQGIKAGHKGTPLDLGIGDAMHASDTQHNKVL